MLEILRPGLLWAGAGLALVALGLHLLRPRVRERRVLPTARFLELDSRSRIRVHRWPDHPGLLALRMGWALALGAAFAGVIWVGPSEGRVTLVVIDGAVAGDDEAALRERARALGDDVEVRMAQPGPDGRTTLATLLRELRLGADGLARADSIDAVIMTRPRHELWIEGAPSLRTELWPGRIAYERVGAGAAGAGAAGAGERGADTAGRGPAGRGETGLPVAGQPAELRPPASLPGREQERWVRAWESLSAASRSGSGDAADAGSATPVVEIELAGVWPEIWESPDASEGDGPASDAPAPDSTERGRDLLLLDGRRLVGGGPVVQGRPGAGATVPLLRAGGLPAGGAVRGEGRCRIVLALAPEAAVLAGAELAVVLESVASEGCGLGPRLSADEVDRALRALLSDDALPASVVRSELEGRTSSQGRSLTPWLLLAALLLGVGEVLRTRRLDRAAGVEGTSGAIPTGASTPDEPPDPEPKR